MHGINQELYDKMYPEALRMLDQGERREFIEQQLAKYANDILLITVVMKEARNSHYASLRKQGFRLVLIGSILGLSGFLITCINFNTNRSIDFAMYGLTSLGISIVFWGLFKIIG